MKVFKEALLKYLLFLLGSFLVLGLSYTFFEESLWRTFFNALAYCSISKTRLFVYLSVLTISAVLAIVFLKKQRVWLSVIYVGLLTLTAYGLCHTVFLDGKLRSIYLYQYKFKHIKVGKLYYRQGWGWVDKVHYRLDHYEELLSHLEKTQEESVVLELSDAWRTPLGFEVSFERSYKVDLTSMKDRWAVITGIMMDSMELSEKTQEGEPWYHGNQLSAWQFDDMSSNLLACLDQDSVVSTKSITDIADLNELWKQDGFLEVQRKVDLEAVWQYLADDKAGVQERVKKARSSWTIVD